MCSKLLEFALGERESQQADLKHEVLKVATHILEEERRQSASNCTGYMLCSPSSDRGMFMSAETEVQNSTNSAPFCVAGSGLW